MRLFTFLYLATLMACSHRPTVHNAPSPTIPGYQHPVGRIVTLQGPFNGAGKFGPYIRWKNESVYLLGENWGPREAARFEGKTVRVTGTLRFKYFGPPPDDNRGSAWPGRGYFYFDKHAAKITVVE
jgi:hypothetical protein